MATRSISNRRNGSTLKGLTDKQRMFCLNMAAREDFDQVAAAQETGYKNPSQAAYGLMKKPAIQAFLGKIKRKREERTELSSDDIWRYLHRVLFYNPLSLFKVDSDGWTIENPDDIPEEIGQLIEKMEFKSRTDTDGNVTNTFQVELVSKATALSIAAKHALVQHVKIKLGFPFEKLCDNGQPEPDDIEQRLIEEKGKK